METMPELKPATSAAMPIDITAMAISSSISVMPSSARKHVFSLLTGT